MRIAYCTNVRLPSERAHGYQVAHVCDAMVKLGHSVDIYAPYRRNPILENYHAFYHADKRVKLHILGSFDPIANPFFPGVLGLWTLNILLRSQLKRVLPAQKYDLLYTRSPALLSSLLTLGTPVLLEVHQLPNRNRQTFVEHCNACRIVSCLTTPMKEELLSWGVTPSRVIVEGDAFDEELFQEFTEKNEAREYFDLPTNRILLGYAGQIESMGLSKGIEVLTAALEILLKRSRDVDLVIAGGPENSIRKYQNVSSDAKDHLHFLGALPQKQIPAFLSACDILLYPAPKSDHPYFQRDTSPLKLFEYMATGKPIVSADLPPIRDILDESMVTFAPAGEPSRFADAIEWILDHFEEAKKKAQHAKETSKEHTWEKRMRRILSRMSS